MNPVEEYLSHVPDHQRAELERVRSIIKRRVPEAEESISYGMPAFKYQGKPLMYYAAFADHMSIFPTAGPTEALKDKLIDYKISKGTVQFTSENPLPEDIIRELLELRLRDI